MMRFRLRLWRRRPACHHQHEIREPVRSMSTEQVWIEPTLGLFLVSQHDGVLSADFCLRLHPLYVDDQIHSTRAS